MRTGISIKLGILTFGSALFFLFANNIVIYAVENYSRFREDPFEKYNFETVEKMTSAIREQGTLIHRKLKYSGHPRIFLRPDNIVATRNKIAAHFAGWMQKQVNLADVNRETKITHSSQDNILFAEALFYQLGPDPIMGVTYKYMTKDEKNSDKVDHLSYGQSAVRHLLDMASQRIGYVPHAVILGAPLAYDWAFDLVQALPDDEQATIATYLFDLSDPALGLVASMNNAPGPGLLGALAIFGDGYIEQSKVLARLDLFYNGVVTGERSRVEYIASAEPYNLTSQQIFTPSGLGQEGSGYRAWAFPWDTFLIAWRDQTGEDYYQAPFLKNFEKYLTYILGNDNNYDGHEVYVSKSNRSAYGYQYIHSLYAVALAPTDPEGAALARHHLERDSRNPSLLYPLLFDPDAIAAKSPAELGLSTSAHFLGNNVFARNGWEGVDAMSLMFTNPTWTSVRDAGTPNDLYIYKHGSMLLANRVTRHNYYGGNKTNTLVLYHDTQPGLAYIPQGVLDSSRNIWLGRVKKLADLNKGLNGYNEGIKYFEDKPGDYVYAFGNGAQLFQLPDYSLEGRGKFNVEEDQFELPGWSRQFVWFRNERNEDIDQIILFDRVKTGTESFQEHLLFNFQQEPAIRDAANNSLGKGTLQEAATKRYLNAEINGIFWYSVKDGATGITVQLKHPETANSPLSVSVTDNAVVVILATDASGKIVSTNRDVADRVNSDPITKDLVNVLGSYYTDSVTALPTGTVALKGDKGIWKFNKDNKRMVVTNTFNTAWGPAHGRLFIDTLLPGNPDYYKVGGPNHRMMSLDGELLPKEAFTGSEDNPNNAVEGLWRVEVTVPERSTDQVYLHVLQAADSSVEAPEETTLLEGDNIVGARVGSNIALFNNLEDVIVSDSVTMPEGINGTYHLLICDLEPDASYNVILDGVLIKDNETSSDVGTFYFASIALMKGQVLAIKKAKIQGDVNGDGKVDIFDLVTVARAFGSSPGDSSWDSRADIADPRDIIDISDLVVVARNFGRGM